MVAIGLWMSGRTLADVLLVQLALGALQPLVIYALAKQLFNDRVGLVAAALTACYGPFIFHQGTLLRDWIPPILEPWGIWLVLRAQATGQSKAWIYAGLVFGMAFLTKETVALYVCCLLFWIVWVHRSSMRQASVAVGGLLLGFIVMLSPLIWRNMVVGAPLLSVSNRALEGFIQANVPQIYPLGHEFPTSGPDILEHAQGRLTVVIADTWALYHGDWQRALRQLGLKARGIIDPIEVPNNLDWSYARGLSPILRVTLGYGLILPIGLAGLILSATRWRTHLPFLLHGTATLLVLLTTSIIARYRLALVPLFLVYGAYVLVWLGERVSQHQWGSVGAGAALVGMIAIGQQVAAPISFVHAHPLVTVYGPEYVHSAQIYASREQWDLALQEITALRTRTRLAPEFSGKVAFVAKTYLWEGERRVQWANHLFDRGQHAEAANQVSLAQADYAIYVRQRFREMNYPLPFEPEASAATLELFSLALTLDPDAPSSREIRRLIERLQAPRP
jgi:hypothetical protein